MPRKRKCANLSKVSHESRRLRQMRKNEILEEKTKRLEANAQRNAMQRAQENVETRSQRLEANAQRNAMQRAQENVETRSQRLEANAQRNAMQRAQENVETRSQRLEANAQRNAMQRAQENVETRSQRLEANAQINAMQRAQENVETRSQRLEANAQRNAMQRAQENVETRFQRLEANAKRNAMQRSQENVETRFQRLEADAQRHVQRSALAMASMGAPGNRNPLDVVNHAPYCLKIHGQYHHLTSIAMRPDDGQPPRYAQLYFLDTEEAIHHRMNNEANQRCDPAMMRDLSCFMIQCNEFAKTFKMMRQVEQDLNPRGIQTPNLMLCFRNDPKHDQRRYNAPRANEIAVVFQNIDGEPPFERDIRIYNKNSNDVQQISILDKRCDPMCYPLLYPYGNDGWHSELKSHNPQYPGFKVTQMDYYAHLLAPRAEFSQFQRAGKLRCQFILDAYMKTEANRLNYIKLNQPQLRAELYSGLMDHLDNLTQNEGITVGIPVILPSSFMGSPRNMQERYQDAMSLVRKFGKPDIFLTMTCNPQCPAIKENLDGCPLEYRPDLIAKTFSLDVKEIMKDLIQNGIFGNIIAYAGVIEFQKRGLPHLHLLAMLSDEDKPRLSEVIDMMVWAEIPDEERYPELNEKVLKHMIHGPCGNQSQGYPCTGDDGKCSKGFPKEFRNETNANVNGYPMYQRRNTGKKYIVRGKEIDNRWVVPYSPYLIMKYDRHINLEICSSVKSVKYLYKYIHKGFDCAAIEVQTRDGTRLITVDEVNSFMDARYVSAPEAMWRLNGYDLFMKSHTVIRLAVHLPNRQMVYFRAGNEEQAAQRELNRDTTLTAWFKLNQSDENAVHFLYTDIPSHYIYEKKETKWKLRKKGAEKIISRLYTVSIKDTERFYLRLLLLHVKGAKCFEDMRTVNGVLYETFKDAAIAKNLVEADDLWEKTIEEATGSHMPAQLRELFTYICIFGTPTDVPTLWNKYKEYMIEDFVYNNVVNPENMALNHIQEILKNNGSSCDNFKFPNPNPVNIDVIEYNVDEEKRRGEYLISTLNVEQKYVYDLVMRAIDNENEPQRLFCIDGFAGSGKTYLFNAFMSVIRGRNEEVLSCASTGIAATLLKGGRTYHSLFKLTIPIDDGAKSNIRGNSKVARELISAKLIIWDEVSMTVGHALTAVDKLLKDLMKKSQPFGGKVILFAGDFRQNLPIVPHAQKTTIIESTVKYNPIWRNVIQVKLKQNMRTGDEREFANWLLQLGDGKLTNTDGLHPDIIEIPEDFISKGSLISEIFGDKITIEQIHDNQDRAILCPKNEDTFKINDEILHLIEGQEKEYLSIDSIMNDDTQEQLNFPTEFLNSVTPSGMPVHRLKIKIGAIIILLRNLNTKKGLCNGTRFIVNDLKPNLIYAEVLNGPARGQIVFIPMIDFLTNELELPFKLKRRQFPIRVAFAMTINKSQGQTLEKVGIYLPHSVFAHG
ncbi:uncharacterized protein [Temnothorax nylanderi]|uniref:uncharacterized protein n=1 Tax=Temnothorax nylanderi TaxID=102681 RepID=UPI003A8825BD